MTPGSAAKFFSAPQKQPKPNTICSDLTVLGNSALSTNARILAALALLLAPSELFIGTNANIGTLLGFNLSQFKDTPVTTITLMITYQENFDIV